MGRPVTRTPSVFFEINYILRQVAGNPLDPVPDDVRRRARTVLHDFNLLIRDNSDAVRAIDREVGQRL